MSDSRYVTVPPEVPAVALTATETGLTFEVSVAGVKFQGEGATFLEALNAAIHKIQTVTRGADKGRPSSRYRAAALLGRR